MYCKIKRWHLSSVMLGVPVPRRRDRVTILASFPSMIHLAAGRPTISRFLSPSC